MHGFGSIVAQAVVGWGLVSLATSLVLGRALARADDAGATPLEPQVTGRDAIWADAGATCGCQGPGVARARAATAR